MSSAIIKAIPSTSSVAITAWLELEAHLDSLLPLAPSHRQTITTAQLMELWHCDQSTVSRRIAAFNKAGLGEVTRANGYQGGWWVKR